MALKDKTIPKDTFPTAHITEAITAVCVDGKLPCQDAFAIAGKLKITPLAVGETADLLNIHLSRCQLGFFGYPGKQGYAEENIADLRIPVGLEQAIKDARNDAGEVSCATLWKLANTYEVPRMLAGYVSDELGIHVTPCQLGAF